MAGLARVVVVVVIGGWKHILDIKMSIFTGHCDGLYTTMFHQFQAYAQNMTWKGHIKIDIKKVLHGAHERIISIL